MELNEEIPERIYEITLQYNEEFLILYSYGFPRLSDEGKLCVFDCFTKETLTEDIFGKRKITVSYGKKFEPSTVEITLEETPGIIIKHVVKEGWTTKTEEECKTQFDLDVLQAYREVKEESKKKQVSTVVSRTSITQEEQRQIAKEIPEEITQEEIKEKLPPPTPGGGLVVSNPVKPISKVEEKQEEVKKN